MSEEEKYLSGGAANSLSRNDETLSRNDEPLSRNDETLPRMERTGDELSRAEQTGDQLSRIEQQPLHRIPTIADTFQANIRSVLRNEASEAQLRVVEYLDVQQIGNEQALLSILRQAYQHTRIRNDMIGVLQDMREFHERMQEISRMPEGPQRRRLGREIVTRLRRLDDNIARRGILRLNAPLSEERLTTIRNALQVTEHDLGRPENPGRRYREWQASRAFTSPFSNQEIYDMFDSYRIAHGHFGLNDVQLVDEPLQHGGGAALQRRRGLRMVPAYRNRHQILDNIEDIFRLDGRFFDPLNPDRFERSMNLHRLTQELRVPELLLAPEEAAPAVAGTTFLNMFNRLFRRGP